MNKLKKVGLTALATTLVASSAYAGELSVSGSASLSYSGLDNTSQSNPWSMGNSVTFAGGGELDNGMTIGVSFELDDDDMDDYSMKIGLADGLGTITFSGDSVNAGGVDTVKDIIPTAYTPVYENADEATAANVADNGLATTSGRNTTGMWGYSNTIAGMDISLGFNPKNSNTTASTNAGSESSIGVSYATPVEGLTVVAGWMDDDKIAKNSTYGAKFSYGPVVAAYQKTEVDFDTGQGSDQDAEHMGVSFAVNENLTISGGIQEVDISGQTLNEENSGVAVSYTMGSITMAVQRNKLENGSGTAARDVTVNTINLSFAF
jgi:outer membrane protein OmpU